MVGERITKGVSLGQLRIHFLPTIFLSLSCSKSKTSLRICIAGLMRPACGSSRSLLSAPNAHRCTYLVAETAVTQRLPLSQGKTNIAKGVFIQPA